MGELGQWMPFAWHHSAGVTIVKVTVMGCAPGWMAVGVALPTPTGEAYVATTAPSLAQKEFSRLITPGSESVTFAPTAQDLLTITAMGAEPGVANTGVVVGCCAASM